MMRKPNRPRIFLETSAVIYLQHGHTLMKSAVSTAIGAGYYEISNFIRMEYFRGIVVNLIELYFLIKESDSVNDALIDWSQKVAQDRKLKVVLMTIPKWIADQEDPGNFAKSLRRLGDFIVRLVHGFDEVFAGRSSKDHLKCQLGRVRLEQRTFDEQILLKFYESFNAIRSSIPNCDLCRFNAGRKKYLARRNIDLQSEAVRHAHAANKGFIAQSDRLKNAAAAAETPPNCRWCERLGDSIIVLQMPTKAILVTADRAGGGGAMGIASERSVMGERDGRPVLPYSPPFLHVSAFIRFPFPVRAGFSRRALNSPFP